MHIVPRLSNAELSGMERKLNGRFKKVAAGFGKGLKNSLLGGGVVGAALGLIDKILNPLQAVQESIDRSLSNADNIVTNAKQFGTTPGELARLQAMGQAKGIEPQDLYQMLSKFQGAIADANKDPSAPSAVRNYAGETNTAEAFFKFIQNLGRMPDANARRSVQEEVFGEKQILKMAELLNQNDQDWKELNDNFKRFSPGALTQALEKTDTLEDLQSTLRARMGLQDTLDKGSRLNSGMIFGQSEIEKQRLKQENKDIERFKTLADLSLSMDKLGNLLTTLLTDSAGALTSVTNMSKNIDKMAKSKIWDGIIKFLRVQ